MKKSFDASWVYGGLTVGVFALVLSNDWLFYGSDLPTSTRITISQRIDKVCDPSKIDGQIIDYKQSSPWKIFHDSGKLMLRVTDQAKLTKVIPESQIPNSETNVSTDDSVSFPIRATDTKTQKTWNTVIKSSVCAKHYSITANPRLTAG